jgi:hypothetical protein
MKENHMQSKYSKITFSDEDVVNKDDFIPEGEYNPHKVHPWLIHDHGFTVCVVFAATLQDALDEAVDSDKLDHLMIDPNDPSDREDYLVKDVVTPGYDPKCPEWVDPATGDKYWWQEGREPAFLGNASEPFDIETLDYIELPNPKFSFCALFNQDPKCTKQ